MIFDFRFFMVILVSSVRCDKFQDAVFDSYSTPLLQSGGYYGSMPTYGDSYMKKKEDPLALLAASIPGGGVPGEDYPILSRVPDTGFNCGEKGLPGYFADTAEEVRCQVFHICQLDGRHDSFLCPNGTLFNQRYFVCDWWYNVDCETTEMFTNLNKKIGQREEKDTDMMKYYEAPSKEYSAPKPPSDRYGPSDIPQTEYAAPAKPLREYGLPTAPAQQYGAPPAPSQLYSIPKSSQRKPSQFYELPGY